MSGALNARGWGEGEGVGVNFYLPCFRYNAMDSRSDFQWAELRFGPAFLSLLLRGS